ncbi:MAG: SDR family NAD(P)-dependent oxidoreductase [Myxococcales bacterium]|nr:SDR family NAD(P)-dependent oxidoreductase [Myxococcales bacterium]
MKVKGDVVLVTGGASGLGEATARRFVSDGARVVAVDMNEERGAALAKELEGELVFVKADVTSPDDVAEAIDAAKELGELRAAVSCAGVGWAKRLLNRAGEPHDFDLFQKVVSVNLIGSFNVMRLAAAAMAGNDAREGQRGVVINTASIAAFDGQIGQIAYAASKGGIVGMTLPAARDLAQVGIRVLAIAPGTFDTPMLAGLPKEACDALAASIPNPSRLGRPSEYAALAAHMVDNDYLNGEVIRLDGCLRMAPR